MSRFMRARLQRLVTASVSAQFADLDKWLANLDAFEALEPATIVPAHGRLGDVALIRRYRES